MRFLIPQISNDGKFWYFSSNEVHPGEVHFYRMPLKGGKAQKLTEMTGANHVFLSPMKQKLLSGIHFRINHGKFI
jgi:Tol biopolymer transport system component